MAQPSGDSGQWLAAARAGSREALGRLFEECRHYLLRIAQEKLDPELQAKGGASDLVQQTFMEAQQHFGQFQGTSEAELLAWLRQLLLHDMADFGRRYLGTTKRRIGREVALDPGQSSGEMRVGVAAGSPSPSAEAMAHEQDQALQEALARLPEDYRRVIELRYQEDRSFEEIGQRMQRSAEAARKLWARAVERLQNELGTSL